MSRRTGGMDYWTYIVTQEQLDHLYRNIGSFNSSDPRIPNPSINPLLDESLEDFYDALSNDNEYACQWDVHSWQDTPGMTHIYVDCKYCGIKYEDWIKGQAIKMKEKKP